MFSVRVVTANYYVAPPIKELDATFSDFRRSEVKQVPVIRIFGSTPAGQKTCLHIHGVFPYIYIPYDGTELTEKYTQQLANSLDLAIQVSMGKASSTMQNIFKVSLVTGMPLYGYHSKERQFLKIYFYNPLIIKRGVELLQSGAVMNKVFQPYEAHIPFILQFLIDYNLYGMNLLNVAAVKFRRTPDQDSQESFQALSGSIRNSGSTEDQSSQGSGTCVNRKVWHKENIPRSQWLDEEVQRQSTCELEADAVAVDILNRLDIEGSLGANPGLVAIWEDEKQRREQLGQMEDLLPPSSPDRSDLRYIVSEIRGKTRMQEIINDRIKQLKDAGGEELTDSLLDEDSPENVSRPPSLSQTPSGQIDFQFSQEADNDGPPLLVREDTEPVVNEEVVHSFMEASQKLSASQKQGSDKELVQLLVDLAHSESQLNETEEGSILSGQRGRDRVEDESVEAVENGDVDVLDALESLHMSQAWDCDTLNDQEDEYKDGKEDSEEEDSTFNTAYSSSQELVDALLSITTEEERISQYDGADDKKPEAKPRVNIKRNIQKPLRFCDDEDNIKWTNLKPQPSGSKQEHDERKIPSTQNATDAPPNPKDKLLKEFVIQVTDRLDEEMIKKIPYWNPVLTLRKYNSDPLGYPMLCASNRTAVEKVKDGTSHGSKRLLGLNRTNLEMAKGSKSQTQEETADSTIWGVKQDSLDKGMVKKTLGIKSLNDVNAKPATPKQSTVRKILGVKRSRDPSGDTSDSNCSSPSHCYSMRTKRKRVTYSEEDDFDTILELDTLMTDRATETKEDVKCRNRVAWQQTAVNQASPNRYKPCLDISGEEPRLLTKKPKRVRKKNLVEGREKKMSQVGRQGMRKTSNDTLDVATDSETELRAESSSEECIIVAPQITKYRTCDSKVVLSRMQDTVVGKYLHSTGSQDGSNASPAVFDDSVISLQSSKPVSSKTTARTALIENKYGETATKEQTKEPHSLTDSMLYSTSMVDNSSSRSRIYSSLSTSPMRNGNGQATPVRRSGRARRGRHHQQKTPQGNMILPTSTWTAPMFSIMTDDSKEEYRDAMWGLAYFSPQHPDPQLSPPRPWSPTQSGAGGYFDDIPKLLSNGYCDGKKNGAILPDLGDNFDSEQMLKEIAEFERDHSELFHPLPSHTPANGIQQRDESTNRHQLDDIIPSSDNTERHQSEDEQPKENNTEKKNEASLLMDTEVVPDSQSEESNAEELEKSNQNATVKVNSEPNNNYSSAVINNALATNEDGEESMVMSGEDVKSTANVNAFDSVRSNRVVTLGVRIDQSKKVVGKVSPILHIKPAQVDNDKSMSDRTKDIHVSLDMTEIKAQRQSFSSYLMSPINPEPNDATPNSTDPMSLMSPTSHLQRLFQAPKERKQSVDSQSEDVRCADAIHTYSSKDNTGLASVDDTKQNKESENDCSQSKHPPIDTQRSDSSSLLTPAQRPAEFTPSVTLSAASPSNCSDPSNTPASMPSTVDEVGFEFSKDTVSNLDNESTRKDNETLHNADGVSLAGMTQNNQVSTHVEGISLAGITSEMMQSQSGNAESSKEGAHCSSDVVTPWQASSDLATSFLKSSGDSTASLFDESSRGDSSTKSPTPNSSQSQVVIETVPSALIETKSNDSATVIPHIVQTNVTAPQRESLPIEKQVEELTPMRSMGKRKLEDVFDVDNNSDKKHKSVEMTHSTEQNTQDAMDSIEDMSIGDSSMSDTLQSQEDDCNSQISNGSKNANNLDDNVISNGDKHVEQLSNGQSLDALTSKLQVSSAAPAAQEKQQTTKDNDHLLGLVDTAVALATQLGKPMKPLLDPPSTNSVRESLAAHGLHEVQHQPAFWSKPKDQPSWNSRHDLLQQTPPKCTVPSELADAQTKLSDIGLHHWRTIMGTMNNAPMSSQAPNTSFNILHEMSNIGYRASMFGEANTVITPCKPPPSKNNVEQWLGQGNSQIMQNNHSDKDKARPDVTNKRGPTSESAHLNNGSAPGRAEQMDITNATGQTDFEVGLVGPQDRRDCLQKDVASTSRSIHQLPSSSGATSAATVAIATKDSTEQQQHSTYSTPLPPCFASPALRSTGLLHSTPNKTPSTRIANIPCVTPIGVSGQRQSTASRRKTGHGPLANLVRRQSLFFTPRENVGNAPLLGKSVSDTSQIEGPTPDNTYDFKLTQHNLQDAKALHEVQHLTILSMELHVRTRRDYRPDPEADPIRAVFFCIQTDTHNGKKQEKGMIVVNESDISNTDTAGTSVTAPHHQQQEHTGNHELSTINATSEEDLFEKIVALIRKHDPDILVGYEIQQLSWGFLFKRAAFLGVNLCPQISRLPEFKKESTFSADKDEYGADHMSEIHIAGRIVLNVWRLMRHEVTLNIYTFENVVFHVLHQRVPKFSFRSLSDWFDHKTSILRWRVLEYYTLRICSNLQLLEQRDLVGRTSELARLFGIQFYNVLSRGTQYRVESMMLRLAKPLNYIAVSPSQQQRVRMKAPECIPLVMEPESRFYQDPVIVLDFQSLYPSMMIAYNYCYSTCLGRLEHLAEGGAFTLGCSSLSVPATMLKRLHNSDSLHVSPNGVVFVKQNIRHGVLPKMLDQILQTRIMVKKSLKDHKDDKVVARMLDSRQLGLKLIANVTYGYTSAGFSGRMPCIEVGDSVVRKGRETLERAISMVENNAAWRARVVYGDTDSMFVLLEGASKERAFRVGKEIAAAVTADNPKPVKLKFEKVYHPCVLQAKKRYVGFKYESPEQTEPEYDAKGIETVRRDACPAVAKILERSIKVLFTTKDISQVKSYVQKQFKKIVDGSASIQDLTFAKEYRGRQSYQPGACVPSLEISRRMMAVDRCSEPRCGERVPYVVVYGTPGLPLIQLVRRPEIVLQDPSLRLNSTYYIARQIVPALNRVLSLLGVDTMQWYQELPRNQRVKNSAMATTTQGKKGTIAQYFSSLNCIVCDKLTKTGLCDSCRQDAQQTAAILSGRLQEWNQSWRSLEKVCISCCGFQDDQPGCTTLDCPVRYKLARVSGQRENVPFMQSILDSLCKDNAGDTSAAGVEETSFS